MSVNGSCNVNGDSIDNSRNRSRVLRVPDGNYLDLKRRSAGEKR